MLKPIRRALPAFVAALTLTGRSGKESAARMADGGMVGVEEGPAGYDTVAMPIVSSDWKLVYGAELSIRVGAFEKAERRVNELLARCLLVPDKRERGFAGLDDPCPRRLVPGRASGLCRYRQGNKTVGTGGRCNLTVL